MKEQIGVICIGYLLDRIIGDPHRLWHPVQGIGKLINWIEKLLWRLLGLSEENEEQKIKKRFAGGLLVFLVLGIVMGITVLLLYLSGIILPQLKFIWKCIICYQMLAVKSLKTESMKVYKALKKEGIEAGRKAVSMIVGRDTDSLSQEGVIKATVETIAENTSDGVIAPLFYMCIFGPLGGLFYKTVNTMDSMIGYKNRRYIDFGRVAAKLDDILNYIPARLSALLMLAACSVTGGDKHQAWKIYKRDRYRHLSPNAGQTEAVCAGALNIELAGPACYFGEMYDKPSIGDGNRKVELDDIVRANELMTVSANIMFLIYVIVAMTIYLKLYS